MVFGMPREAIARGEVDAAVPLDRLAGAILFGTRRSASRRFYSSK